MNEMIERVTDAIRVACHDYDPRKGPFHQILARAALEAMREPTEAMLDAAWYKAQSPSAQEAWRVMINEALR